MLCIRQRPQGYVIDQPFLFIYVSPVSLKAVRVFVVNLDSSSSSQGNFKALQVYSIMGNGLIHLSS